jgi:hypothetical protein
VLCGIVSSCDVVRLLMVRYARIAFIFRMLVQCVH